MADIFKIFLIFMPILLGIWYYDRKLKQENKILVLSGYPKGCKTFLKIYHQRDIDKWVFEWDNCRFCELAKTQYRCGMESGKLANTKEIQYAFKLLQERGLM
jgi:hypothetical protein